MTSRSRTRESRYDGWTFQQLLDLRFCDLKLRIEGSELEQRVGRLYRELEHRGISFRPHVWLSYEWFSPDRSPGIAIPFYLAHPRLKQLEGKQMHEVEGGSEAWCMRILRHEAGHAIDTAYQLHRRKHWRELFGSFNAPYPEFYNPRPYSRDFVTHLDMWYAQAHPAEDFAETFAVWLRPGSQWRKLYRGWPAMRKLLYVDQLMRQIAGGTIRRINHSRRQADPLKKFHTTLREHYRQKHAQYAEEFPDFYDRDLRMLFSDDAKDRDRPTAAGFLRRIRREIGTHVARWTGEYQYTIDQVMTDMIHRCRELKLRVPRRPARRIEIDALTMVTVQTMNYLHAGRHRVAL